MTGDLTRGETGERLVQWNALVPVALRKLVRLECLRRHETMQAFTRRALERELAVVTREHAA